MAHPNRHAPKYVYDLPYFERMELCRILDQNDKWEELGGIYMKFDMLTIQSLRREIMRGNSPTDELLTKWGHQNHTILELFVLLSKMQHYQAMLTIKQFVDVEYHKLIFEGEQNLSRIFKTNRQTSNGPSTSTVPSVNHHASQIQAGCSQAEALNIQYPSVKTCKPKLVNMNVSESNNVMTDKFPLASNHDDEGEESKILNVDPSAPPQERVAQEGSSNGSNNAQTVLMKQNQSPASQDRSPSNMHPQRVSRTETLRDRTVSEASSIAESVGTLPMISFKELDIATNGWDQSTVLGKGGFGTVYKGTWKNTQVAIKRTRNPETDESHSIQIQQILGELKMLNSYRHDNVLPLYGYSVGGDDPCLIYQFMPNGSLEDRLLCRQNTKPLSWYQRHNIATGTARGLQFLHTIGEKPLIHGDIKSANILLDSNYEPKIGDFGLAREGPYNHYTHMKVSRVHGTRPYLPDEFLRHKKFSTKVDTHSFGIVMFELATGLRAYDDQRQHKFLRDLIENTGEGHLAGLVDKKCGPDEQQTFSNLIALGKCCISKKPKDRPEMVLVLKELDAMAVKRDMLVRVQSMIRQNSLTPTNPYEMQVLHDHLSQQRKLTPSPSNPNHFRAISPQQPQPEPSHVYTPVPHKTQVQQNTNPFLTPLTSNNNLEASEDLSLSPNTKPNPFSVEAPLDNHNSEALRHSARLYKQMQPSRAFVSPAIAVSPPSEPHRTGLSSSSIENAPQHESSYANNEEEDDFMSQFDNVLPLISVLGIKGENKEMASQAATVETKNTGNIHTSAKGKSLWILEDSN